VGDNVGKGDDQGVGRILAGDSGSGVPVRDGVKVGSRVTVNIAVGCGVRVGRTLIWAAAVLSDTWAVGSGAAAGLHPASQR
jgi:hypothetical protein